MENELHADNERLREAAAQRKRQQEQQEARDEETLAWERDSQRKHIEGFTIPEGE